MDGGPHREHGLATDADGVRLGFGAPPLSEFNVVTGEFEFIFECERCEFRGLEAVVVAHEETCAL